MIISLFSSFVLAWRREAILTGQPKPDAIPMGVLLCLFVLLLQLLRLM